MNTCTVLVLEPSGEQFLGLFILVHLLVQFWCWNLLVNKNGKILFWALLIRFSSLNLFLNKNLDLSCLYISF